VLCLVREAGFDVQQISLSTAPFIIGRPDGFHITVTPQGLLPVDHCICSRRIGTGSHGDTRRDRRRPTADNSDARLSNPRRCIARGVAATARRIGNDLPRGSASPGQQTLASADAEAASNT
jgi:hypothetical protein